MKHDLRLRHDRLLNDSRALVAESRVLARDFESLKRYGAMLRKRSAELAARVPAKQK